MKHYTYVFRSARSYKKSRGIAVTATIGTEEGFAGKMVRKTVLAVSLCHYKDQYAKKHGRDVSVGRAQKAITTGKDVRFCVEIPTFIFDMEEKPSVSEVAKLLLENKRILTKHHAGLINSWLDQQGCG